MLCRGLTSVPAPKLSLLPAAPRLYSIRAMSSSAKGPNASSAIDFLLLLQNLKLTKRTGWVRSGVQGAESIADHMYRMSMMALVAGDSGVNVAHAMKVALVHDITESIVGDITPHCGVSKEEKFKLEQDAIKKIREMLGQDNPVAQEIEALWYEYEEGATPEAQLIKDFDKLEMVIQAHEYERDQGLTLEGFFTSTRGKYITDTGRAWAAELEQRRERRLKAQAGAGVAAEGDGVEASAQQK